MTRLSPWVVTGVLTLFGLFILGAAFRPDGINADNQALSTFRRLPVVEGGRVKPMDTVARTYLRLVSGREEFYEGADVNEDKKLPAIRWMLDVMAMGIDTEDANAPARLHSVIRIDNEQVLMTLKLSPKPSLRYRVNDLASNFSLIQKEAERAESVPKKKLTRYDSKIAELHHHVGMLVKIAQFVEPRVLPPDDEHKEWRPLPFYALYIQASQTAEQQVRAELGLTPQEVARLNQEQQLRLYRLMRDRENEIRRAEYQRLLAAQPPLVQKWRGLLEAHRDKLQAEERRRKADATSPAHAAADSEVQEASRRFNAALADIRTSYDGRLTARESSAVWLEAFYNKFAPFYRNCYLYGAALVLALISLMTWQRPFRWSSFSVISLAVIVHTIGILMRMYIQGRPPVTNLYSSAIFIGWGAVLLGLGLEVIYGRSIANIVGAAVGLGTSIIAHNLGSGNDTMEMMQAVLDTNFWLATHVTCITLGYTATFVAGFLGIAFISLGLFTPLLDSDLFKRLTQMIYGVLCFATLLSFTGTVLGGIWADQSWGRFWGWDPKENGAVIIVIWNAIILHARWAGMIKQRGLAVMAVFGNVITAWSWFGTNMLGIGLHSYGFLEMALPAILSFDSIMIAIMAVAAIPPKHWRSFGGQHDGPATVPPADPARGKVRRLRQPSIARRT